MNVRIEFGNRIRELRARSGMSQEILAHRAGMDRSYLSGVERGLRNISLDNIERLAKALNVSISYMFAVERLSDTLLINRVILPFHSLRGSNIMLTVINGFCPFR